MALVLHLTWAASAALESEGLRRCRGNPATATIRAVDPVDSGMGGSFLYRNRRQSLSWLSPVEYLALQRLKEASYPSLSQYAPNERNPLPSLNA